MEKHVGTYPPIINHHHAIIVQMTITFDSTAFEMSFFRPMRVNSTKQSNIALVSLLLVLSECSG